MTKSLKKILVANRGEIACRIIRTARRMEILTVAIVAENEREALHASMADEIFSLGPDNIQQTYLDREKIVRAACEHKVDAVHPGYGFLSEDQDFAERVTKEGLVFIGPAADTICHMGEKDRARQIMKKAGLPVVPGLDGEDADLERRAGEIGYPLLIKAASGGGGKGMRKVNNAQELAAAMDACRREAGAAFGNDRVFIEKYIERARHIEVQIFGDNYGDILAFSDRDCSLQRRHQKVIEEAPAPGLSQGLRTRIHDAALAAGKKLSYSGAGTVEFILDASKPLVPDSPFYFMEMNTRLQVEHPVTEMIFGLDLVEWQIRVAAGEALADIKKSTAWQPYLAPPVGHAFEARIYAENPERDFAPQTGTVAEIMLPAGVRMDFGAGTPDVPSAGVEGNSVDPGGVVRSNLTHRPTVRFDTGIRPGDRISPFYDPLLAKLCVHAGTREEALEHMHRALAATLVAGTKTNQGFLARIFATKGFRAGTFHTQFIEENADMTNLPSPTPAALFFAALLLIIPAAGRTGSGAFADKSRARAEGRKPPPSPLSGCSWRLNHNFCITVTLYHQDRKWCLELEQQAQNNYKVRLDSQENKVKVTQWEDGRATIMFGGTSYSALICPGVEQAGQVGTAVNLDGEVYHFLYRRESKKAEEKSGTIIAPMPGRISEVLAREGDYIEKNAPLIRMEAMKIETLLRAGRSGHLSCLKVKKHDIVEDGQLLAEVSGPESGPAATGMKSRAQESSGKT